MSIPVPIAVQNESWYNSWWNQNPEDETDVGTLSHWDKEEGGGARCMEEMRGASFAGSSPPFLGRERAAVGVETVGRWERETLVCIKKTAMRHKRGK